MHKIIYEISRRLTKPFVKEFNEPVRVVDTYVNGIRFVEDKRREGTMIDMGIALLYCIAISGTIMLIVLGFELLKSN